MNIERGVRRLAQYQVGVRRRTPAEPVAFEALLAREQPAARDVVAGIVRAASLTVLSGDPEAAGALTVGLALCVAAGTPSLAFPTRHGRVLVLTALAEDQLQRQLRTMLGTVYAAPTAGTLFFLVDRKLKLDSVEGSAAVRRHLEATRADLLVLDPSARFRSAGMGAFVAALDALIQDYGVAIVATQRPRRLSSPLAVAADVTLALEQPPPGRWRLVVDARGADGPAPLELVRDDGSFTPATSGQRETLGQRPGAADKACNAMRARA